MMKKMLMLVAILCVAVAGVNAAVVVTDHASPFDVLLVPDFATGHSDAEPGSTSLFGFDAGEVFGQTFTLDSAIELDSIYVGYGGYKASSTQTLTIDTDNDGLVDYTFAGIVLSGLQPTTGNDGPFSYVQFDLSSEGINLAAGEHAWALEMTAEDGDSWAWAPSRHLYDTYAGGYGTGVTIGGDNHFAVTGVPEPATMALLGLGGLGLLRRKRN